VLIYVNDIIVTRSSDEDITGLLHNFRGDFDLKDLGSLHFYLGIDVNKFRIVYDLLKKNMQVRFLKRLL
jgi:hypothetical protein